MADFALQTRYEIMLLFTPDVGEEVVKKELDEIRKHIASGGGKFLDEEFVGLKELAYRIQKKDHGFYVLLNVDLSADKIAELDKSLNLHHSILRHLVLHVPTNYQFKGLAQYDLEAEEKKEKEEKSLEGKKERKLEKARKVEKAQAPKAQILAKPKKEKTIEEKTDEATEEKSAEKPTRKSAAKPEKSPAEEKSKLDELDEKLKSIINDPDISL